MSGSPFDDPIAPPAALLEMQAFLSGAFRSPRALAERPELEARMAAIATGNDRLSPVGQADVYREQFWFRHIASLKEDFPTLRHLLGSDAAFELLCERYLEAHPPRDFLLRDLSADMGRFLSTDARYDTDTLLIDCARVEWAFIDAYDAADAKPFDPSALIGAAEDALFGAKLIMQPALRLVAMQNPAHELRESVRAGVAPERPAPRAVHLAIFRTGEVLRSIELEPAAFAVVQALLAGAPLGEACNRAIEAGADETEVGAKLGQWFQWWTQWGWLERIVLA